jgi:hypothetical protein
MIYIIYVRYKVYKYECQILSYTLDTALTVLPNVNMARAYNLQIHLLLENIILTTNMDMTNTTHYLFVFSMRDVLHHLYRYIKTETRIAIKEKVLIDLMKYFKFIFISRDSCTL